MISVKRLLKLNPRAWDVLKLYLDWVSLCAVEKNLANATNEFLWMGSFPDATHFLFLGGRRLRCNNLPVAEFGERCEAQGLVPEGFLTSADGEMIADIPSKGGVVPVTISSKGWVRTQTFHLALFYPVLRDAEMHLRHLTGGDISWSIVFPHSKDSSLQLSRLRGIADYGSPVAVSGIAYTPYIPRSWHAGVELAEQVRSRVAFQSPLPEWTHDTEFSYLSERPDCVGTVGP